MSLSASYDAFEPFVCVSVSGYTRNACGEINVQRSRRSQKLTHTQQTHSFTHTYNRLDDMAHFSSP